MGYMVQYVLCARTRSSTLYRINELIYDVRPHQNQNGEAGLCQKQPIFTYYLYVNMLVRIYNVCAQWFVYYSIGQRGIMLQSRFARDDLEEFEFGDTIMCMGRINVIRTPRFLCERVSECDVVQTLGIYSWGESGVKLTNWMQRWRNENDH